MLGFLLMLAVRVLYTSFDPIFISFTYNNIATALGIAIAVFLYFADCQTPILHESSQQARAGHPGWMVTAMGFGALLFLTHFLFGDVSVVSHWAVAPYPDRGPYPYPWR